MLTYGFNIKLFTSVYRERLKHSDSYYEQIITVSNSLHETSDRRKLSYRNGYGVTDYRGKE